MSGGIMPEWSKESPETIISWLSPGSAPERKYQAEQAIFAHEAAAIERAVTEARLQAVLSFQKLDDVGKVIWLKEQADIQVECVRELTDEISALTQKKVRSYDY